MNEKTVDDTGMENGVKGIDLDDLYNFMLKRVSRSGMPMSMWGRVYILRAGKNSIHPGRRLVGPFRRWMRSWYDSYDEGRRFLRSGKRSICGSPGPGGDEAVHDLYQDCTGGPEVPTINKSQYDILRVFHEFEFA